MKIKTSIGEYEVYIELKSKDFYSKVVSGEMSFYNVDPLYQAEVKSLLDMTGFVIPDKSIVEHHAEKQAWLNATCREKIEAGFSLLGHTFLYRESPDQTNMNTAAIGIMAGGSGLIPNPPTTVEFETVDAGKVVFTNEEFLNIFLYAETIHKKPLLDRVFAKKEQIKQIMNETLAGEHTLIEGNMLIDAVTWDDPEPLK